MADKSPEDVTQTTPIGEVDTLLGGTDPIIVHRDDSLHRLAEYAVERPTCRVLSVVDGESHLIGLVPVRLLVNDIFLKIVPEEFLGIAATSRTCMEYATHLRARTAGDIMLPPVSIHRDQTVRDAFEVMHKAHAQWPAGRRRGRTRSWATSTSWSCCWCGFRRPAGSPCSGPRPTGPARAIHAE